MTLTQRKGIDATKPIVLIPAYNEAKSIAKVLGDLSHLRRKGIVGHIVVVNDGSLDNTTEIALKRGANAVIKLKKNSGKAMAFFEGLSYCLNNVPKAQIANAKLVLLDADLKGITEKQIKGLVAPLGNTISSKKKFSLEVPKIGMTIGTVKGDINQNLSGQRGFKLAELKPLAERPQLMRRLLGSTEHRRGYGLETFLNYYFTRQPTVENISELESKRQANRFAYRAAIVPTIISAGIGTIYQERPGRNTMDHKRFIEELWGSEVVFADRAKLAKELNAKRLKMHELKVSSTRKKLFLKKRALERKSRLDSQNRLVGTIAPRPGNVVLLRKR